MDTLSIVYVRSSIQKMAKPVAKHKGMKLCDYLDGILRPTVVQDYAGLITEDRDPCEVERSTAVMANLVASRRGVNPADYLRETLHRAVLVDMANEVAPDEAETEAEPESATA